MTMPRTSKIWADTIHGKTCSGRDCHKPIWLAQNVKTGNYMPFNVKPVAISVQPELETGREIWLVDLATAHHATCPNAPQFRRRGR